MIKHTTLPFESISHFSIRDHAFKSNQNQFAAFLSQPLSLESVSKTIEKKSANYSNVMRALFVKTLAAQYEGFALTEVMEKNIERLAQAKNFVVVTAHQPCLLSGPLYFIYKIATAIKWAREINEKQPSNHIVPLYVIGSEDHDFEEINHLNLFNKKLSWERSHGGAVGPLTMENTKELKEEILSFFERSPFKHDVETLVSACLNEKINLTSSIRQMLLQLFGAHGLLMIDLNVPELKRAARPLFEKEIRHRFSHPLVLKTQEAFSNLGYDPQVYSRPTNLFYLDADNRTRIEYNLEEELYSIGEKKFNSEALLAEFDLHPAHFSPNVILRPVFQETILPNLTYIGGGAEMAYWMEINSVFDAADCAFPMLMRRDSALWINKHQHKTMTKMEINVFDLLMEDQQLIHSYLQRDEKNHIDISPWKNDIDSKFLELETYIKNIDSSLSSMTQGQLAQTSKFWSKLESKINRAIKQQNDTQLRRIEKLKQGLFPQNTLQERKSNMLEMYAEHGQQFIDVVIENMQPTSNVFHIFSVEN